MTSEDLIKLFSDISYLPKMTDKKRVVYQKLVGDKILDFLYHLPTSVIERKLLLNNNSFKNGDLVTLIVNVDKHIAPPRFVKGRKIPFVVKCSNENMSISVVYFHNYHDTIRKNFPIGSKRVISGNLDRYGSDFKMTHPDYIKTIDEVSTVSGTEPVYPLSSGISKDNLIYFIKAALSFIPDFKEWLDIDFIKKNNFLTWKESILKLHNPSCESDIDFNSVFRRRLAYDELLAYQLSLKLTRLYVNNANGCPIVGDSSLINKFVSSLPFKLTDSQREAFLEINTIQKSNKSMMHLLHGDVGSGKTVVSLMCILNAIEANKQAAFMAPTDMLAKQHFTLAEKMFLPLGLKVVFLSGSVKGRKKRQEVLESISSGEAHVIIGTHALFQDDVEFKDLGLAVIDEQHRFGVNQRMKFTEKGFRVDTLLMSATPIPRTLSLALYGDIDVYKITEKPLGRKDVDTYIMSVEKTEEVTQGLKKILEKEQKIYWVCPLIEESEKMDLMAVEDRYKFLKSVLGDVVALVHGKMSIRDREKVMQEFYEGSKKLLVATTVIEVGIDVKEATVMIIEHAERFGLSQLHQLRGRVGRNDIPSTCILLYKNLGVNTRKRLEIMRKTNDGFLLAEEDLRIRGSGELIGTKQSGVLSFRIANLFFHSDLLYKASIEAGNIVLKDPRLNTKQGKALRNLLKLFDYSSHIKYISSG